MRFYFSIILIEFPKSKNLVFTEQHWGKKTESNPFES